MTMGSSLIAWTTTVLFAATGIYCLWGAVTAHRLESRVGFGVHLLMSLVMLAMPWSWYTRIPTWAVVTVFAAAALWYVYLAGAGSHGGDPEAEASHHGGPRGALYHAGMMASMVWMAVAMGAMARSPAVGAMGGDVTGTHAMPGMEMSGADHAQMVGLTTPGRTLSIVLGILFAGAAVSFLARLIRSRTEPATRSSHRGYLLLNTVMAVGMALSFLVLMV